ncbi:3-dehydroquinate synthase [Flavicella sediminum]|uniref:3-dehydroquinate synthase n=1 Tax=Flavicella sediminum TaxID=2585141 RepID=UPI00111F84DC|nr:3-dehydroquinate synthase [Flavicella sediminum]
MQIVKKIQQQVQVTVEFELLFTKHLFHCENEVLKQVLQAESGQQAKAIVIVDKGVSAADKNLIEAIKNYFFTHKNTLQLCGEVLEVLGGEAVKNNKDAVDAVLDLVNIHGIDRHSYVIAIGGGAVLDAIGFAASIAHRGVRLVRVPTTVLSQNDSGIGVKNGINYFGKKNFMGSFSAPYAVINDAAFLETLHIRDWRSGISEAIKVALINDYSFFEWIEENALLLNRRNASAMDELIFRCAKMHMDHIRCSGDAFEQGSSRPLDFGHWAAHKLEQLSNFEVKHGEAVAIGIALDSTYSYLKGFINVKDLHRVLDCILNLGFLITYPNFDKEVLKGLEEFREHLGGRLTIMLLAGLGNGFEVNEMDETLVLEAIQYMSNYKK